MTAAEITKFGAGVRAEMEHLEAEANGVKAPDSEEALTACRSDIALALAAWSRAVALLAGVAVATEKDHAAR